MKKLSKRVIILVLMLLSVLPSAAAAGDVAVIANRRFPKDAVTLSYLKKIYLGHKGEEGGVKIVPLDRRDSAPAKKKFIGAVLSSTVGKYKAYWLKQIFREGSIPPTVINTPQALIAAVRKAPGAVGYVDAAALTDKRGIKVILTIK